MTLVALNCGFGAPIGGDDLRQIRELGFWGIRQDVLTPSSVEALLDDVTGSGLFPLFVAAEEYTAARLVRIARDRGWQPDSYAVEFMNEANRVTTAAQYAQMFSRCESAVRDIDPDVQLVVSGISSVTAVNCAWLEQALTGAGGRAIVGFHGYRRESQPSPFDAQVGFNSRSQEFADLHRMAGVRQLWSTEVGWHSAQRTTGSCFWKRKWRLSDSEIAANLREEIKLNDAAGVEVLVIYQYRDGPSDMAEDRYGIFTFGGQAKPQAHILGAA